MGIFRKSGSEPLGVTMAGVKLGQRFLAIGTRDPHLVAALAVKTGITGRACVVEEDEERLTRGAEEIEKEGALVEPLRAPFGMLPLDAESFDVAVVAHVLPGLDAAARAACVAEVFRVLRPGGRAIVIEAMRRGGLGALLDRQPVDSSYHGPTASLRSAGFSATRILAETNGIVYAEGTRRA